MTVLSRLYALLLYAYPKEFRERFGAEMRQTFRDRWRAVRGTPRPAPLARFFFAIVKDWMLTSSKERIASMKTIPSHRLWRATRGLGVAAVTVLLFLLATTIVLQAYVISTPSMEGSLQRGDHILVDKLVRGSEIRRDDLVTFRYPVDPSQTFVKRVIGLPGDHIRLIDKQVIRNGRRLVEPYVRHGMPSTDPYRGNFPNAASSVTMPRALDMLTHHVESGEVIVPAGSLFVLGDNRDMSLDSRYWGFVPMENVIGRPMLVYWSYDAATEDLVGWNVRHFVDVAGHLFTKTRWNRTPLKLGTAPPREEAP